MANSIDPDINDTQIIRAIESISQRFVIKFHDEANGYAFQFLDKSWGTIGYSFIHDIAREYDEKGNKKFF